MKKMFFCYFLLTLTSFLFLNSKNNLIAAGNVIQNNGFLEIIVLDSSGTKQPLEAVYVSCAAGQKNMKTQGISVAKVRIIPSKYAIINCQVLGEKRWIADLWHHENAGEPLIMNEYSLFVNGKQIGPDAVWNDGAHANFRVLILNP